MTDSVLRDIYRSHWYIDSVSAPSSILHSDRHRRLQGHEALQFKTTAESFGPHLQIQAPRRPLVRKAEAEDGAGTSLTIDSTNLLVGSALHETVEKYERCLFGSMVIPGDVRAHLDGKMSAPEAAMSEPQAPQSRS